MRLFVLIAVVCLCFSTHARLFAEDETADLIKVNDVFDTYSLEDQFGEIQTLRKDTKTVIASFDMKLSKSFHKWLKIKEDSYLDDNKAEYIIDIRGMPKIITYLFAGPKMKKYGFPIRLIKEGEYGDEFPKQEKMFTVITLNADRTISDISFIDDFDELANQISPKFKEYEW